ncbi:glycosyltransferase family 4 protein [Ornithinimicrobium sp. Y1847]|uniref:glycosyltransferase family 4 protein n=1 Tax=Ornithinimicrobium sp. Y1847 TaxID=3405419 RepID=UPI003B66F603
MRILLLTHYYHPELGPPQLRWSALVRDFVAAGHEVHVVAPPPHYPSGKAIGAAEAHDVGGTHLGQHGETVHRVRWREHDGSALTTLVDQCLSAADGVLTSWRRRRQIAPDVVVSTVPALPTMGAGFLASRLLRVPWVLEMRDAWPDLASDARNPGRALKQQVRWYAVGAAARGVTFLQRRADVVVTTTDSFTQTLVQRGLRRVSTVRNAHHPVPGLQEPGSTERRGWAPGDPLHVVYVGTVGRAQDLETAVRALALARAAGADVRMRVLGTGARLPLVRSLVAELGAPVELLGHVPRSEIYAHYQWADTLLVSLRDWKGLHKAVPSKLYEALALGLHVSGMVAGETADIIEATGAGFAVAPRDEAALAEQWVALTRTGTHPDRDRMRAWAAEHASEAGTGDTYLALLRSLVPAPRHQAAAR